MQQVHIMKCQDEINLTVNHYEPHPVTSSYEAANAHYKNV